MKFERRLRVFLHLISDSTPVLRWTLVLFVFTFSAVALEGAAYGINYQGRIIDKSGTPLRSQSVQLVVWLTSTPECILYSEHFNVDMSSGTGGFSVIIGKGRRSDASTISLEQIFNPEFEHPKMRQCPEGFKKTPNQKLYLNVSFNDGNGYQSLQPMEISAAPYSMDTINVAGIPSSHVLRVDQGVAAPLTTTNFNDLLDLINGTSNKYARINSSGNMSQGEIPFLDDPGKVSGNAITSGTISGSTAIATSGNITTSGSLSAASGISTSGNLSVTGNISTNGSITAVGNVVSDAISTRSITLADPTNQLITLRAPATGMNGNYDLQLPASMGANNKVLTSDGVGGTRWDTPFVTSISAGTGLAVVPNTNGGTIVDLGTIGLANTSVIAGSYGNTSASGTNFATFTVDPQGRLTAAASVPIPTSNSTTTGLLSGEDWNNFNNKISTTSNFGGDISGVPASISVDKIRGQAVSSSMPTDTQILIFNGTEYVPRSLSSDVTITNSGAATVRRLQNQPLSATVPSLGALLKWTGTQWEQMVLSTCSGNNKTMSYISTTDAWSCLTIDDNTKLSLSGGTMSGNIAMGGNTITSIGNITMNTGKTFLLSNNTSDPSGLVAADKGKIWFDASNGKMKYYDGANIQTVGAVGASLFTLNSQTGVSQSFATPGASGTAPSWNSSGNVHTLNIPLASATSVTAGLISKNDYDTFSAKLSTTSTFAGDISGPYNNISVDKIKGKPISSTAPTNAQILIFNGTQYNPVSLSGDVTINNAGVATVAAGSVTNADLANSTVTIASGTGLSGGGTVSLGGSLTLNNTGVTSLAGTANQIIASSATGGVTLSLPQNIHTSASPTFSGITSSNRSTFFGNQTTAIGVASSGLGGLELQSANSSSAAFMTFHRPGAYAAYFGLDTDNQFKVGGWSMGGTSHRLYHSGNLTNVSQLSNDSGYITANGPTFSSGPYTNDWFRVNGSGGIHWQNWDGGWYMQDGTWIRTYANKSVWTGTGLVGSDGGLTVGYGGVAPGSGGVIIAGNVGIGTSSPSSKLHVSGGNIQLDNNRGLTWSANSDGASIRFESTSDAAGASSLILETTDNGDEPIKLRQTGNDRLVIASGGNVGIGTSSPRGRLDVSGGAISGAPSVANGSTAINFVSGNIQHTTGNCGGYTLYNLKDGGTYIFIVKGTAVATCSFSASSDGGSNWLTVHMPPDHGATTSGKHTLYNFLVSGGDVYISWVPGY